MSLRWAILGTGSQANCYFFQTETEALVVDAGFPLKTFRKRALKAGLDPLRVQTVFLTHSHGDHIRGLEPLLEETDAQLVHAKGLKTEAFLRRWKNRRVIPIESQTSYHVEGVDFWPFDLSHDAPHATGYHFKIGGVRFCLITDTGTTNDTMCRVAARSQVLFLESNYCPELLAKGPYPPVLKERVAGDRGHLSNIQCVDFLNRLADLREQGQAALELEQIYLIHLSENNNTPEAVEAELKARCRWPGPIRVCQRSELVLGLQVSPEATKQSF